MPSGTPAAGFRPLTRHAVFALQWLAKGPQPRQEINSGVNQRLEREALTETFLDAPPYSTNIARAARIQWVRITAAGLQRIEDLS